jgi:6-phosphogluconolactonase (cycloisomerase 2 family)
MPVPYQRPRALVLLLALTAAACLLAAGLASSAMAANGAVYTQTNDPAGNTVQRFALGAEGSLTPDGSFATGGAGLAALGGRQGAVELSGDGRQLYAVNAGSNTVSVFHAGPDRLKLVDEVSSGGVAPASIAAARGRVYVLNAGNVTAFDREDGTLRAIGTQALAAGASGAAQVAVTPDGKALVVSERLANRLETLPLDSAGRPGEPVVTASSGAVPFGFGITQKGTLVVSEAGGASVSSYRVGEGGALGVVSASLPVGQGAPCWVAVSPSGRLAYTGNGSGSISGYAVAPDGSLTALDADGLTAPLIPSPRDLDFDESGRFLLAVSPGNAATGGRVTAYRVAPGGSLSVVSSAPAAAGITGAAAS